MKKRKIIVLISIGILLLILTKYFYKIEVKNDSYLSKNKILNKIERTFNKQHLSQDYIKKVKQYLKSSRKDSSYYFIHGYFDYINNNFDKAILNFNLSKKSIVVSDSSFTKIYTYIFLNKSLINKSIFNENSLTEKEYLNITENCKTAFDYIECDEKFKNDSDTVLENLSVLSYDKKTHLNSLSLLNSYLKNTPGLTNECKITLLEDLGFLYSLNHNYTYSIYQYLNIINIINDNPYIKDGNIYKVKSLINIGNINFTLNNYHDAISYYLSALNINIDDKQKNAMVKSMGYINIISSYTEIHQYKKALSYSDDACSLLKYADDGSRSAIELLIYNNLALPNIYTHNFDKAKEYLDKSSKLLSNNKSLFSFDMGIYIDIAYGELYKEKKMYKKSLELFNIAFKSLDENNVEPESKMYKSVAEIYKTLGDLYNYDKYINLFIDKKSRLEDKFREDYMKYSSQLYESDKLKSNKDSQKLNLLVLLSTTLLLIIILILGIKTLKVMQKSNFIDDVTQLFNRKYLEHYIEENQKDILKKEISVILIDIDFFKKYNDHYGHVKGDFALREVSTSIKDCIRKQDIAIRYGGEEMLIILPNSSVEFSEIVAKSIIKNLRNKNIQHKDSDVSDTLTISMGIYSTIYEENDSIYSFIEKADEALYFVKNNGKNGYKIY